MSEVVPRDEKGLWKESGNPAGRPKGQKDALTQHKQELELALRKALPRERLVKIIEKVVGMAEEGNLRAAKLILDKVMSNAKDSEDPATDTGAIRIVIVNATEFADQRSSTPVIEVPYEEVSK